ncbi:DUF4893 domain-containing protein [Verticiella sediminum]|uniref:DUF4893 domain-containing protein n=1 Tax=Verticiella sediminum TaxID=1247510 RepID=A0A556AYA6_9BURK|nr:DUF4893 domain-containing protein [Verticiella sediminum]TSH97911.1 DUF4893 domain-containing protein [Verticiella sediminum]
MPSRLFCAAGAAALLLFASAPVRADAPFPDMLTSLDRDRLSMYEPVRRDTLAYVRKHGEPAQVAELERVLEGSARDIAPAELAGVWRCRVIKLARVPELPIVIYQDFECRITDDSEGLRLEKLTGSQRTGGTFYDIGETRLGYAGALALGDEAHIPRYGEKRARNQVGYLVPISPQRMRLEFPRPPHEADLEILELHR